MPHPPSRTPLRHHLPLGFLLLAFGATTPALADPPKPPASASAAAGTPAAFALKGFQVISHQIEPVSKLHVWGVQHPSGSRLILYSTPDNKVFFTGALWDATTGANISDPLYTALEAATQHATKPATPDPSRPPAIPEPIQRLSKLKGIKDGDPSAPLYRTVFVFFDPRCPHCRDLYSATHGRPDLKGKAIVWLPTTILGDKTRGAAYVAEILQGQSPNQQLQVAFAGLSSMKVPPSEATNAAIRENEQLFFTAFGTNPNAGQASVPVAFFVDRLGRPQMVPNPIAVFPKMLAEMY
jgi:thiol:disulfide interchange protein DsbG